MSLLNTRKVQQLGGVIVWICEYLDTPLPQNVVNELNATRYRSQQAKTTGEKFSTPAAPDNTATAILKLLEKLDAAVNAITEAADDICQTVSTARKLNEDCINANFDVLTGTVRDGIESVKTTIRKGQK